MVLEGPLQVWVVGFCPFTAVITNTLAFHAMLLHFHGLHLLYLPSKPLLSCLQKLSYSLLKESDLRSKNMYPGKTKHLFLRVSLT